MEFKLHLASEITEFFRGDASYDIKDGVLWVIDEEGNRRIFSPHAWIAIEDRPPEPTVVLR
jgi:hypothetical protein